MKRVGIAILFLFLGAIANAQDDEAFEQEGLSDSSNGLTFEEYGQPIKSALEPDTNGKESDLRDELKDLRRDESAAEFANSVPEPVVKKSVLSGDRPAKKVAKVKKPKSKKSKHIAKVKAKRPGKKSRSVASVSKRNKKYAKHAGRQTIRR